VASLGDRGVIARKPVALSGHPWSWRHGRRRASVGLEALSAFGAAIGLAFQIADDVLDVTATTDRLGKTAGRDLELAKGTYPRLLGVAGAERRAGELVTQACSALEREGLLNEELEALAHFAVERAS
jgi:geranylgeranyl pyrophosphate synthase